MNARLANALGGAPARAGATAAKKAPARPGGPVPAETRRSPGQLPILLLAALARNPLRSAGGALVLVLTVACLWNTLMAQRGRHPAPLFGPPPEAAIAPEPQRRAEAPPMPVPRPDPATVASITEGARAADPIGSMIREDVTRPGAARTPSPAIRGEPRPDVAKPVAARPEAARPDGPKPEVAKQDQGRIAAAQRTLSKLGYGPLASDGLMGPGTRAAIERFERDRKLPVTGAVSGRTAKVLGIDGA